MRLIGFDIETTSLEPWRNDGRIITFAVATEPAEQAHQPTQPTQITAQALVVPDDIAKAREKLTKLFTAWVESDYVIAAWNAAFEIAWLSHYLPHELIYKTRWLDGMLLWKHLENSTQDGEPSFGLKVAVRKFFPEYAGYEADITFDGSTPIEDLLEYNKLDAYLTVRLVRKFWNELDSFPKMKRCAWIEAQSLVPVGIANGQGLVVDVQALDALDASLVRTIDDALTKLQTYGLTEQALSSPVQLRKILFDDWKLPVLKEGKTGASTDKTVLHELSFLDERAALIRTYREAVGNRRKFVETIRKSVTYHATYSKPQPLAKTYPQANVFGTYTGRITYNSAIGRGKQKRQIGFALHQMKRAPEFRRVIRALDGYMIVEFDAAGQEFRWMAVLSRDDTMLNLCQPGQDPHAYMGAAIAGLSYDEVREGAAKDKRLKEVRQLGKVANLSLQYRTSASKLQQVARVQYGMDMDAVTAEKIYRTYQLTYPGVPRYWRRQIEWVNRHLYVETLAGRRVRISRRQLATDEWSAHSTAINFPIQGTGADQKYLALLATRGIVEQYEAKFLFDLHDGLYFLAPKHCVEEFIHEMLKQLNHLPYKQAWGFTPTIPLPFDCKFGPSWGDMVEFKE